MRERFVEIRGGRRALGRGERAGWEWSVSIRFMREVSKEKNN